VIYAGPRKLFIWPAKPQILFILLPSLIKTLLEPITTYQLWPLAKAKKKLWPAMRFELCTPDLWVLCTKKILVVRKIISHFIKNMSAQKV